MKIKRFRAENFRNAADCDISFCDGVNLLYGENAQGKTNAVEGIYLFARGRSFRKTGEKEIVRFGEEGFSLSLTYEKEGEENDLSYTVYKNERKRMKNGYKVSLSEMIGDFRAVLFIPDHLLMVKQGPEERRSFLDIAISQCYPAYLKYYSDYKRTAEERNALLRFASKGMAIDHEELRSWSYSLSQYASYLYLYRKNYIERLQGYAASFMKEISDGKEELSLSYKCDIESTEDRGCAMKRYFEVFTSDISREIAAGTTLFGLFRDDMEIMINGKSARFFASQGQQRSAVLSLKLAEGEVSREMTGEYPVFLFDDVLSELDEKRRNYLLRERGEKQIVITSCSRTECESFSNNTIEVKNGRFQRI